MGISVWLSTRENNQQGPELFIGLQQKQQKQKQQQQLQNPDC